MDGTLLDEQGRISEENRDAIAWFCRQGGLFTLATGRMEASVAPYLEQVEVNAPLILYNGARLVDMRTRTVLWEAFLPPEAYELVEAVRAAFPDVNTVLYHGGVPYAYPYTERVAEHERKDGVACARLDRLADLPPGPLTKVLWII
nr:Cof-type HAD-IIB family hydrolase [Bacillota bacterium]